MLTFEAEISPGMPVRDVVALGVACEEAGFDRLGISDVVLWPDCYLLETLVAQATSRIGIGSMVTNPYTRHPVVHAAALATLQDVSDGRAFFGIGVGAGLEPLGIDYPRPVTAVRETVEVVRALLAGDEVSYRGETVSLAAQRLVRPPEQPVPVSIGTRSPKMMALAGEVADIALIGARCFTPQLVDLYQGWLADGATRAGRPATAIEVAPRVTLCVSDDGDLARASVKRYVAHYLCLLRPDDIDIEDDRLSAIEAALGRSSGWYFDHDRHDDPELATLVTDELVAAFAVAGTAEQCAIQLRSVVELGFTSVSCNLAAPRRGTMAEALLETIRGGGDAIDLVRRGG